MRDERAIKLEFAESPVYFLSDATRGVEVTARYFIAHFYSFIVMFVSTRNQYEKNSAFVSC